MCTRGDSRINKEKEEAEEVENLPSPPDCAYRMCYKMANYGQISDFKMSMEAVLPNGSLLCDLGLIKTFFPKKCYFSRFFCLKVVFFYLHFWPPGRQFLKILK